jgi:1-phosphofructokinase
MIYTVTFNPSLDYTVKVEDFREGMVNRTAFEAVSFGGKGVNVSCILRNLGLDNVALGFIAGFTGKEIERRVRAAGIRSEFIELHEGFSRINVKLKAGQETEINGQGPKIPGDAVERLLKKLDALQRGDTLVLAGTIPSSLSRDAYETILSRLDGRGVNTVVDATGELMLNVLRYRPFLVKPNSHELGEIFGTELIGDKEIMEHGKKLQELGARNVLISMAARGAILITEAGSVHKSLPPEGRVKGSTGAGDSMVAGFLAGYLRTGDPMEAFRLGLAAGSATAFSEGLATGEEIMKIYDRFQVQS